MKIIEREEEIITSPGSILWMLTFFSDFSYPPLEKKKA